MFLTLNVGIPVMRICTFSAFLIMLFVPAAHAGFIDFPIPLPVVGATGPFGIAVAVAGYVLYRLVRKKQ